MQKASEVLYTVTCTLSGSTTFFQIISQTVRFGGGEVIKHKMCVYRCTVHFEDSLNITHQQMY